MIRILSTTLILASIIIGCATEKTPDYDLIIKNVRLIDVRNNTVSPPVHLAVNADTIAQVADADNPLTISGTEELDGTGLFAMPGLWDMHVHFRGGDSLADENKALLPHFLSHGITTVRDAGGDLTPQLLKWREAILKNELNGPEIFTSGPKLDGPDPAWPGSLPITEKAQVTAALDSLQLLGVDYVKIYDGSLTPDLYYEIISQAKARGFRVTGHMPMNATLDTAVSRGLDGIEHLYYVLFNTSAKGDSIRQLQMGYGALPYLLTTYEDSLAGDYFSQLGKREFYATPTLHIGQVLTELQHTSHMGDSLLPMMGEGIRSTYARREQGAKNRSPEQQAVVELRWQTFMNTIKPLHNAGVVLLAGSDCGPFNSYVYPGESLLSELELLVEAGLTPAQALQCSVINGPKFFGLQEEYGTLEAGKKANLLLLTKDPLENISNIRSLQKVILKGRPLE